RRRGGGAAGRAAGARGRPPVTVVGGLNRRRRVSRVLDGPAVGDVSQLELDARNLRRGPDDRDPTGVVVVGGHDRVRRGRAGHSGVDDPDDVDGVGGSCHAVCLPVWLSPYLAWLIRRGPAITLATTARRRRAVVSPGVRRSGPWGSAG